MRILRPTPTSASVISTPGSLQAFWLATRFAYGASQPHAAISAGGNTYDYDANGNMTQRVVGGQSFNLAYDAENRLVAVSGALTGSFVYDGDGNRVKSTIGGATTYFVGNIYEVSGGTITKYYYAGSTRVAMRQGSSVYYLLTDQRGSTTVTMDAGGNAVAWPRYKPCPCDSCRRDLR